MEPTDASAVLWVFPLLVAVVFHEWAHGYVAYRCGDDTAERLGRLTINPLAHVDPIGTVLMPGLLFLSGAPFLFGYAKPVPISWHNLRNPVRDMVYVAAAGPAMNLLLAVASAILLGVSVRSTGVDPFGWHGADPGTFAVAGPIAAMAWRSVLVNVVLAVFNLLPIPPLDGGRMAVGLLPDSLAYPLTRLEPFGFTLVLPQAGTHALGEVVAGRSQVDMLAVVLADGRVLMAGGLVPAESVMSRDPPSYLTSSRAVLYDPVPGRWEDLPPMPEPRAGGAAIGLGDGSALLLGGYVWETLDFSNDCDEPSGLSSSIRFVPGPPPPVRAPLSGFGTATIDGVLSPGEWDRAASRLLRPGAAPRQRRDGACLAAGHE